MLVQTLLVFTSFVIFIYGVANNSDVFIVNGLLGFLIGFAIMEVYEKVKDRY